jgi:hypothetical protein
MLLCYVMCINKLNLSEAYELLIASGMYYFIHVCHATPRYNAFDI